MNDHLIKYLFYLADSSLILGQRLGEWCGHGPILEQDIAMTNISLDCIGRARLLYQRIAEIRADGKDEDQLAFMREENEYLNLLLSEHPNRDFAYTVARQFFLDAYFVPLFERLSSAPDEHLARIAAKSLKESQYHYRWSSEWMIRLGDGTEESHKRIQEAVNRLWVFTGELLEYSDYENALASGGIIPSSEKLSGEWNGHVNKILGESLLQRPAGGWFQNGGKNGRHTEHLGYMLADMQYMQRVHPGLEW